MISLYKVKVIYMRDTPAGRTEMYALSVRLYMHTDVRKLIDIEIGLAAIHHGHGQCRASRGRKRLRPRQHRHEHGYVHAATGCW